MAIPTVGGGLPEALASKNSITIAPYSSTTGDMAIYFIATATAQPLLTTTGATPKNIAASDSGWTQMTGSPQTVTGGSRLYGFWRRNEAGEAEVQTSDSGEYQVVCAMQIKGVIATGTPIEAVAFGQEEASDTTLSIPAITTLGADRLIIGCCTTGADTTIEQFSAWTNANLASPAAVEVEGLDKATAEGGGGGLAVYKGGKAAEGSTGATTATLATASSKAFVHLAVIPTAAAAPGPPAIPLRPHRGLTMIGQTSI